MNTPSPGDATAGAPTAETPPGSRQCGGPFAVPGTGSSDYTDGRPPGEWQSKFPKEARTRINWEACFLAVFFLLFCLTSGVLLGLSGQSVSLQFYGLTLNVDFRLLAIFSVGCLGGTTFSIKWLVHSVAKCKWHVDRCYWRFFVPIIGGVYACVVLTLLDSGMIGAQATGQQRSVALTTALAFLIGYFSDGVSGLLSNVANAVFGTLEKK